MDWLLNNFQLLTSSSQHKSSGKLPIKIIYLLVQGIKFEIVNNFSNAANTFLDAMGYECVGEYCEFVNPVYDPDYKSIEQQLIYP